MMIIITSSTYSYDHQRRLGDRLLHWSLLKLLTCCGNMWLGSYRVLCPRQRNLRAMEIRWERKIIRRRRRQQRLWTMAIGSCVRLTPFSELFVRTNRFVLPRELSLNQSSPVKIIHSHNMLVATELVTVGRNRVIYGVERWMDNFYLILDGWR